MLVRFYFTIIRQHTLNGNYVDIHFKGYMTESCILARDQMRHNCMKLSLKICVLVLLCLMSRVSESQVYRYDDEMKGISFAIDIPETSPFIKGIYFFVFPGEGNSGDIIGGGSAYDEIKEICTYNDLAFLGGKIGGCDFREVYDEAMDHFSNVSHHQELRKAPLIFDGVSGGVEYTTCFAYTQFPEKTIAYIVSVGVGNFNGADDNDILTIPALWVTGGLNADGMLPVVQQAFYYYRGKGALWSLVIVPGMGHARGSNNLILPYVEAIIKMRIISGSEQLRIIPGDENWLGNITDFTYAPYNEYVYSKDSASWLPDSDFAAIWQIYNGGHPTTSADIIADKLSLFYVSYEKYNAVLYITNNYQSGEYLFVCTDVNGRVVFQRSEYVMENQRVEYGTHLMSTGVYYIRITSNVLTRTIPVVIN
jgi:hypothetical protein